MNTFIETWNQAGEEVVRSMASMLVQSSILIALLAVAELTLLRRARAAVRYCCWLVVLVKLVLPPTLTLPTSLTYWSLPAERPIAAQAPISSSQTGVKPGNGASERPVALVPTPATAHEAAVSFAKEGIRPGTSAWLAAVWLGGFVAMAALLVVNARCTRRWLARIEPGPAWLDEMVQTEALRLGIRGRVRCGVSHACGSPVLCGIRRPSVIIPAGVLNEVDREGMRAIVLHELSHLRRGDLWVGHLQAMVQAVYWWHPLVWIANRFIRAAREQAVDDAVAIALHGRADDYAATLVRVARLGMRQRVPLFEAVGAIHSGSSLKTRVRRLLEQPLPKTDRVGWRAGVAIAVLALVLVPMRGGPRDARATGETDPFVPAPAQQGAAQPSIPVPVGVAPVAPGALPVPAVTGTSAPVAARPAMRPAGFVSSRVPSISIHIGQDKENVRLNEQVVPLGQVSSNLTSLLASTPGSVLRITMDPAADFATAIAVLDAAKQVGATNLSLSTTGAAAEAAPSALPARPSMNATMSAEMARRYGIALPNANAAPPPPPRPTSAQPTQIGSAAQPSDVFAPQPATPSSALPSASIQPGRGPSIATMDQRLMKRYGLLPPTAAELRFALEPMLMPVEAVRPVIAEAGLTVRSHGVEFHVIDPKQLSSVRAAAKLGQTTGASREPNFIVAAGSMNMVFGPGGSEEARVGRISVQSTPGSSGARLELSIALSPTGASNGATLTKSDADIALPNGSGVLVALPLDSKEARDGRFVLVYPVEQAPTPTPAAQR